MKKQTMLAVAILALAVCVQAQTPKRVCWWGNSYSEAGRQNLMLPKMINCDTCGINSGMKITIASSKMVGGCDFSCLEGQGLLADIDTGHYDIVMGVDGHVAGWFWMFYEGQKNSNAAIITDLANHAKAAGGILALEQEWVQITNPPHPDFTQTKSDFWYDSLRRATGCILIPSGNAWWGAYRENPNLEYISPEWNDGSHPGKFTAYLNMCCMFASLTGISPVGHKWKSVSMDGQTLTTLIPSEALFAQQQAWDAYQYFQTHSPIPDPDHPTKNQVIKRENSRNLFQAAYEPSSRIVKMAGTGITGLRIIRMDGSIVAAANPGEMSLRLAGDIPQGMYLAQAFYGRSPQSVLIRIGD
jgi:hypothetical protein